MTPTETPATEPVNAEHLAIIERVRSYGTAIAQGRPEVHAALKILVDDLAAGLDLYGVPHGADAGEVVETACRQLLKMANAVRELRQKLWGKP